MLGAVAAGELDQALVPIENALEGTVSATIDGLVFDHDLVILQEIVLPIHLHLLARPGVALDDIKSVRSYVHALAQVRVLRPRAGSRDGPDDVDVPGRARRRRVERAVGRGRQLARRRASSASRWWRRTSKTTPTTRRASCWSDATTSRRPPDTTERRSSASKTPTDPGSLYAILGRFAARDINLTKLESRPTKQGLGDYCFVIEFEGHVADDVVADCLADLQAHLARVKFLGSYPVTGEGASDRRERWLRRVGRLTEWIETIRARVLPT